ncbi:hypothetical protein [Flavobacterium sp.]|jgi:hypothetical protein|uniref:hypothetical protein n=1 Tax=Flavobacterium sp. TaxID=239 RepID=UPI0037C00A2F
MSYLGIPPFGQTARTKTEYVATAGQSVFNVPGGYIKGYIDVKVNGRELPSTDFTATDGLTIVLAVACLVNDDVIITALWPVTMADTYRKSEVDAAIAENGGAKGADKVFFENGQVVTQDYTITTGKNAISGGPITINNGVNVTIPSGSNWVIV